MPIALIAAAVGSMLADAAVTYGLSTIAAYAVGTVAADAVITGFKGGNFLDNLPTAALSQAPSALSGYGASGAVAGGGDAGAGTASGGFSDAGMEAAGGAGGTTAGAVAGQAAGAGFGDLGSGYSDVGNGTSTSLSDTSATSTNMGNGFPNNGNNAGPMFDPSQNTSQAYTDYANGGQTFGQTSPQPGQSSLDTLQSTPDMSGGGDVGGGTAGGGISPDASNTSSLGGLYDQASSLYNKANTFLQPVGGAKKVGAALYDFYSSQKKADALQNNMNSLANMYAPGTPEAELMRKQMEARDAAAGRRSQYGTRQTELAAKLAAQRAQILGSNAYQQMNAGYLSNKYNGLDSLFKLGS